MSSPISSRNNEREFKAIFEKYHVSIFRYIYHMTGNRSDAEDIVQEVFIKIHKGLSSYQEEGNPC